VTLVDTSVWIDHLHDRDAELQAMLIDAKVMIHPFVIGELAVGSLRQRKTILGSLAKLPQAVVAHDDEVLRLIEEESLHGTGIGYIDSHLLASTRLTNGGTLWTRDLRLASAAARLGLAIGLPH